jgi:hypothetical protein
MDDLETIEAPQRFDHNFMKLIIPMIEPVHSEVVLKCAADNEEFDESGQNDDDLVLEEHPGLESGDDLHHRPLEYIHVLCNE